MSTPDPRHHIRLGDLVTVRRPDGSYSLTGSVQSLGPGKVLIKWGSSASLAWVDRDDVRCGF